MMSEALSFLGRKFQDSFALGGKRDFDGSGNAFAGFDVLLDLPADLVERFHLRQKFGDIGILAEQTKQ